MDKCKDHITGKEGESKAAEYLQSLGYKIIDRNFICKHGEIDIVAFDSKANEYVFVEVKTRTNFGYGKPIDAVDKEKQKHIVSATNYYIYINNLENQYIRFDIIQVFKNKMFYIKHNKNVEITAKNYNFNDFSEDFKDYTYYPF